MDALKDIWASLVAGVKERTTNPLSFAFLLSWSAWNFKFFVVLFGDGTSAQRIAAIEALYPHQLTTYLQGALLYPLVTALLYVFGYPFVSAAAIKFYRGKQVEIANSVKDLENGRLINREEMALRTRRHEAERKQWVDAEATLDSQIVELREALEVAEKQITDLKKTIGVPRNEAEVANEVMSDQMPLGAEVAPVIGTSKFPTSAELDAQDSGRMPQTSINLPGLERKLVLKISDSPGGCLASQLADALTENFTLVELALEKMRRSVLVRKTETGRWQLTPQGKDLAAVLLRR